MSRRSRYFVGLIFLMSIPAAFHFADSRAEIPREPMKDAFENSLMHRLLNKEVQATLLIDDMESLNGWRTEGNGQMSATRDRSKDGKQSLRFTANMRDEEFLRKDTEENGSFVANQGGSTGIVKSFDTPQDWSGYNRVSLWVYVHPTDMYTCHLILRFTCLDSPTGLTVPHAINFVQDLMQGEWNQVVWEIPNLKRDKVTEFAISETCSGNDPEVGGIVTYDFDKFELQKVDAEKYEGWEVAPGRIAYNHAGYTPGQTKTAFGSGLEADEFQLMNASDNLPVFSGKTRNVKNRQGSFQVFDFSEFSTPGRYYIKAGEVQTREFEIGENVWSEPILKAINFFYCERCGYHVPGIHRECHRDWLGVHDGEIKVINGGWHDAGDLSQGSFRTSMAIYAMMDIVDQLEKRGSDAPLKNAVLEEATWGLRWLLKTRFRDGYRMTWSKMRMYTDCITGTYDDVITPAQNVPWENFLASGVEAHASLVLREMNPELARESLTAAEEDWNAAVRLQGEWIVEDGRAMGWAIQATYLTASWGAASSAYLYRITGKKKYMDKAVEYGRIVMDCQEREFKEGISLTGYFYTCPEKISILHHVHAAFEEAPIIALTELCKAFPEHRDWIEWYGAIVLHSDYFMKRGAKYSEPYYLIPNSVCRISEAENMPDGESKQGLLDRIRDGVRLTDEYYLRRFPPIWYSPTLHGNTNVQLSETMALTAAGRFRSDPGAEDLAYKQLQWVFGGNPFSQSLMYGEGYDYAPMFVRVLKNVVGSLPVGIDCLNNDEPYWSGSNYATFKEVWVVPASRFLGVAGTVGFSALVQGTLKKTGRYAVLFTERKSKMRLPVPTDDEGNFRTLLPPGEYEIEYGGFKRVLTIVSGGNYNLNLDPTKHISITASIKKNPSARSVEAETPVAGRLALPAAGKNTVFLEITAEGNGIHEIDVRVFNGIVRGGRTSMNLEALGKITLEFPVRIRDARSPFVAVVIPDGDFIWKQELTGVVE